VDVLHRKFPDGLVDLENIHAPALDGACVGLRNRSGEERQLHDGTDQDECNRDNVPGAHDGSLDLQKL
jgi:hypothetical protein